MSSRTDEQESIMGWRNVDKAYQAAQEARSREVDARIKGKPAKELERQTVEAARRLNKAR